MNLKKGAFNSRGFKKYFQRAEGLSNSISTHSFSKMRLLYSKIALFQQKVSNFQLFFEKQKARFYTIDFWLSNMSKKFIKMYDKPSEWAPFVSKALMERHGKFNKIQDFSTQLEILSMMNQKQLICCLLYTSPSPRDA